MAFSFYRSITIDHTLCGTADSTDIPVMISGTYAWMKTVGNGGDVQSSSGYDIVFSSDSAGVTVLAFERVAWNPATGACEFHVKVPSLSHSVDTVIYVQYGDASISTDQQDKNGTWNSAYCAVYHFGDASGVNLTDSTSNAENGTNHGTASVAGLIGGGLGGAADFTAASSQYAAFGSPTGNLNITGDITLECLCSFKSVPQSYPGLISKDGNSGGGNNSGYDLILHGSGGSTGNNLYYQISGGAQAVEYFTPNSIAANTPYYASISVASGSGNLRVGATTGPADTENVGSAISAPASSSNITMQMGKLTFGAFAYLDGVLDEVRISNVARSSSWISATFNTLMKPSSFYAVGTQQSHGGSGFNPALTMNNQVI